MATDGHRLPLIATGARLSQLKSAETSARLSLIEQQTLQREQQHQQQQLLLTQRSSTQTAPPPPPAMARAVLSAEADEEDEDEAQGGAHDGASATSRQIEQLQQAVDAASSALAHHAAAAHQATGGGDGGDTSVRQAAVAAHQYEVLATARSTPPHRVRRQLLDAQLAEQVPALEAAVQSQARTCYACKCSPRRPPLSPQVPALEAAVQSQAVELAEARAQLATLAAQAKLSAKSSADEMRAKSRQLEEAERRWRNHQHDGETKLRLLEEQVRASDGL